MDFITKHNLGPEIGCNTVDNTVENLRIAMDNEVAVTGLVTKCSKELVLTVDLGNGLTGYIEAEDVMMPKGNVKKLNVYHLVGKYIKSMVTEIVVLDDECNKEVQIKLSRKLAQMKLKNYIQTELKPGYTLHGKVSGCENYGVFVDIGCGVHGLIQSECLSVGKIPSQIVAETLPRGVDLTVLIKDIHDGNIFLTYRELLGTWKENISSYNISNGCTVLGVVTNKTSFGLFVALAPNVIGLADEVDGYEIGDKVSVHIRSVIDSKLKVKLNIISKVDANKVFSMTDRAVLDSLTRMMRWEYADNCEKRIHTEFEDEFSGTF